MIPGVTPIDIKGSCRFLDARKEKNSKFSLGAAYSVPPLITDTTANSSTFHLQTARSLLHLLIASALKAFKAWVWHPCGQPPGLRLGHTVSSTQSCVPQWPWEQARGKEADGGTGCTDKTDVWENYIRAGFLRHCEQLNANKP